MKVLMVCLGNICRSPMAEGILRKKIDERNLDIAVDSAGTSDYHVDDHPDPRAILAMKKNGIDISGLRGRQFAYEDFARFDRIYVMDSSNLKNVLRMARTDVDKKKVRLLLDHLPDLQEKNVPDPWYGDMEGFYPVYELLDKACDEVLKDLETGG